jgi:hypothetical protein
VHQFQSFIRNDESIQFFQNVYREILSIVGCNAKIIIFGEFAGLKIVGQRAAVGHLEQFFNIFAILVRKIGDQKNWLDLHSLSNILCNNDLRIVNSTMFPTFDIIIDYSCVDFSQIRSQLNQLTHSIDHECPVAKYFGLPYGKGEGLVWRCVDGHKFNSGMSLLFKTKALEFMPTQITEKDKMNIKNNVDLFVERSVTDLLCHQAIDYLKESCTEKITIVLIQKFIIWITDDILREDSCMIKSLELKTDQVKKLIGLKAAKWFKKYLIEQYEKC